MGLQKGAGFDEILANAWGTKGEEALVRELHCIRIYNRLVYLPLDLQGYSGSWGWSMSALIFTVRGNLWNRIPSFSLCAAQGGESLLFTPPLRSFGGGWWCPGMPTYFTTSRKKEPTQIPKGSCCWSIRVSSAALDVMAPAPPPAAEVCNPHSSSLSTGFPSLHLSVCLSVCLPPSFSLTLMKRGAC